MMHTHDRNTVRFGIFVFLVSVMIAAFVPRIAGAAELAGRVEESGTGRPLKSVRVTVESVERSVRTGDDGGFSFDSLPAGEFSVRFSRVGFEKKTVTVTVPLTQPLVVALSAAPVDAGEVLVTARGREVEAAEIPGSVEVITDEDLRIANPVNLPGGLASRPGLAVNSEMPWSSRLVVRGLTRDQVVLLVDGSRVVTATATAAQFGTIAHDDIERVEVLKGPLSVLYGSGSTGGVVNVITRRGRFTDEPSFGFTVRPSYESAAGGLSMYGRAEYTSPRWYMGVSQYNRSYADYRAADDTRIPNSQFSERQTSFDAGIKVNERHTLAFRFQYFEVSDAGIPGASSFPLNALASYPETSRMLVDGTWTWTPAFHWWERSSLKAYYQPVERRVELLPRVVTTMTGVPDSTKNTRVTALDFHPGADHLVHGFRWQNVLHAGNHTVTAGVEGWQKHMESFRTRSMKREIIDSTTGSVISTAYPTIEDTPVPESFQRPVGVYAEDDIALGDRLNLTFGARVDHIHTENERAYVTDVPPSDEVLWEPRTDDDISWSMTAGGVLEVTDGVEAELAVARSFRSPTVEERYLYAELGKLTVGDPSLDPERGTFVETGLHVRRGPYSVGGSLFANRIEDMVILKPGGLFHGRDADVYTNAGEALLRGGELTLDWLPVTSLLLSGSLSYVRGTDEYFHEDLPSIPPVRGRLAVRWGNSWWVRPELTAVATQDHVAPGERTTPGYELLDITAGTTLDFGGMTHELTAGMKNVFDRRYRDHLTVSRGYDMLGMGRSLFLSWMVDMR